MRNKPTMALDSRIKLIATAAAGLAVAVFGTRWLVAPSEAVAVSTIAAAVATITFGVVWRIRRAPAFIIVLTTMALTISSNVVVPEPEVKTGTAVALVMMAIVGVVLLRSGRRTYLAVAAVALALYPQPFSEEPSVAFTSGVTMAISVALGGSVVLSVLRRSEQLQGEYERLFSEAPVAMVQQDWSAAATELRSLGLTEREHLVTWLMDRPEEIRRLVTSVNTFRANDEAARMAGVAIDDMLGQLGDGRVHGGSLGAFAEQLASLAVGEPVSDVEYDTFDYAGRPMTVRVRAIPLGKPHGATRVLVAITDLTDRVASERALHQALASKDEFIAGVSHELRTPLAAVVGLTATILAQARLEDEDRELMTIVAEQSDEMSHIIEDLLVAARADSQALTVIPQRIDPLAEIAAALRDGDVTVTADDRCVAWADPVRLRQILRNLLTNADRYGREPVRVRVLADGGMVRLEVSDAGDPIPTEARTVMFEPYGTVHRTEGLTASVGLGLSVSRTLARLMGGDITYHHDGRSTFTLTIPEYEMVITDDQAHRVVEVEGRDDAEAGVGGGRASPHDARPDAVHPALRDGS